MRTIGGQFTIVGVLAVLMAMPMLFVSGLVQERKSESARIIREVGQEWGGAQSVLGPVLIIPVEYRGTKTRTQSLSDPQTGQILTNEDGSVIREQVTVPDIRRPQDLFFLPHHLNIEAQTQNSLRL